MSSFRAQTTDHLFTCRIPSARTVLTDPTTLKWSLRMHTCPLLGLLCTRPWLLLPLGSSRVLLVHRHPSSRDRKAAFTLTSAPKLRLLVVYWISGLQGNRKKQAPASCQQPQPPGGPDIGSDWSPADNVFTRSFVKASVNKKGAG